MTPGAHAEVCGSSPVLVKHGTPILPAVLASNVEPSLLMPSSPTSDQAPNYVCRSSEKSSDPAYYRSSSFLVWTNTKFANRSS